MAWWTRARGWWHAHPLATDTVLALAIFGLGLTGQPSPETRHSAPLTAPLVILLAIACAALVFRRRAPVIVWVVTTAAAAASMAVAAGPAPAVITSLVALYTIASLRRARTALVAAVITSVVLIGTYHTQSSAPWPSDATYTLVAVSAMACAVGFAVRSNRAVVAAAEERARVAEQTREEEAQRRVTEERLRIARELHDVVAHHIAVINVQSGVARHLISTDPEAAAQALGHVREASDVVLSEMSTILGLLRNSDEGARTPPAPGLAQLDALVDSVRRSGTSVSMRTSGRRRELAPGVDLAAYRIVQECLTNAGRHGTGPATLELEYRDDAIVIDITNPVAPGRPGASAEGGHGLVGMRERASALGGRLDAGARPDGRFVVHAELPAQVPA